MGPDEIKRRNYCISRHANVLYPVSLSADSFPVGATGRRTSSIQAVGSTSTSSLNVLTFYIHGGCDSSTGNIPRYSLAFVYLHHGISSFTVLYLISCPIQPFRLWASRKACGQHRKALISLTYFPDLISISTYIVICQHHGFIGILVCSLALPHFFRVRY